MKHAIFIVFLMQIGCNTSKEYYRDLPVTSSTIVHACGAAEAEYALKTTPKPDADDAAKAKASAEKITEFTVDLGTSGDAKAGFTAAETASAEKARSSEKTISVKLSKLPDLRRCIELGYILRVCKLNEDETITCEGGLTGY